MYPEARTANNTTSSPTTPPRTGVSTVFFCSVGLVYNVQMDTVVYTIEVSVFLCDEFKLLLVMKGEFCGQLAVIVVIVCSVVVTVISDL